MIMQTPKNMSSESAVQGAGIIGNYIIIVRYVKETVSRSLGMRYSTSCKAS